MQSDFEHFELPPDLLAMFDPTYPYSIQPPPDTGWLEDALDSEQDAFSPLASAPDEADASVALNDEIEAALKQVSTDEESDPDTERSLSFSNADSFRQSTAPTTASPSQAGDQRSPSSPPKMFLSSTDGLTRRAGAPASQGRAIPATTHSESVAREQTVSVKHPRSTGRNEALVAGWTPQPVPLLPNAVPRRLFAPIEQPMISPNDASAAVGATNSRVRVAKLSRTNTAPARIGEVQGPVGVSVPVAVPSQHQYHESPVHFTQVGNPERATLHSLSHAPSLPSQLSGSYAQQQWQRVQQSQTFPPQEGRLPGGLSQEPFSHHLQYLAQPRGQGQHPSVPPVHPMPHYAHLQSPENVGSNGSPRVTPPGFAPSHPLATQYIPPNELPPTSFQPQKSSPLAQRTSPAQTAQHIGHRRIPSVLLPLPSPDARSTGSVSPPRQGPIVPSQASVRPQVSRQTTEGNPSNATTRRPAPLVRLRSAPAVTETTTKRKRVPGRDKPELEPQQYSPPLPSAKRPKMTHSRSQSRELHPQYQQRHAQDSETYSAARLSSSPRDGVSFATPETPETFRAGMGYARLSSPAQSNAVRSPVVKMEARSTAPAASTVGGQVCAATMEAVHQPSLYANPAAAYDAPMSMVQQPTNAHAPYQYATRHMDGYSAQVQSYPGHPYASNPYARDVASNYEQQSYRPGAPYAQATAESVPSPGPAILQPTPTYPTWRGDNYQFNFP